MKVALYSCGILLFLLCQACNKADVKAREGKTLDSLSVSLTAMANGLNKTDTVLLQKSIARFNYYRKFIIENIHDTILKEQADNLKHFFSGGENLEAFSENRKIILQRAELVNLQLSQLKEDLKSNVDLEILSKFSVAEKVETLKLTEAGYLQQERFQRSFEEFKNALNGVEALIRSRNYGNLPTIIKDTINL